MQGLEFLKLLKNVKKFLEEVYGSHIQVFIVFESNIDIKPGDVILRPTKEDYRQILRRLKFEKSLEEIRREKEAIYANTGGGFEGYP